MPDHIFESQVIAMLPLSTVIAFSIATIVSTLIPGPTVAVIVASSMRYGTRAGLLTALGTEIGVLMMVGIVAVGLEAVMSFMGWAFEWIKLAGAAYLIYLGWKLFTARQAEMEKMSEEASRRSGFVLNGFLVVWSNPKTLLFFGAFLPPFVSPDAPAFPQLLTLGGIVALVALFVDVFYAFMAGGLRSVVSDRWSRLATRVSGLALMGGGIWLALQKRA